MCLPSWVGTMSGWMPSSTVMKKLLNLPRIRCEKCSVLEVIFFLFVWVVIIHVGWGVSITGKPKRCISIAYPPPPPLSEGRNYVNKFNISLFDFLQWNSEFSLNIRFLFPLNVEFGVSSFFFFCRILNLPSVKSVHHRMLAQPHNILQKYKKNLGILYWRERPETKKCLSGLT